MVILGSKYRDEVFAVQNVEGDYIIFHKKKGIPRRVCIVTPGSITEIGAKLASNPYAVDDDAESVLDVVFSLGTLIS